MAILDIIALTAALGLVYLSIDKFSAWRRLRHIPGPFLARFTHLWVIRHVFRGEYSDKLLDLHDRYGPMVVLAPDFVSLSDPAEIKQIGKVRSSWGRASGYNAFRFFPGEAGDSILSVRDEKAHSRMRAKLMPGYAGKTVEGVEQMVDKHILQLIQESFSCLERDADFHGYLNAIRKAVAPLLALAFLPLYPRLMDIPALRPLFPDGGLFPKVFEMAKYQVSKRYGARAHELKERNDVLGTWVAAGLGQTELENETVAQLTAGGETTGTGIRAVLLYLLTSPGAYRTLQREIDEALESRAVTSCPVSEFEASQLPYLQAVVKESLRLIAPAAFFPKSSPNDETLCGFKIPAGTNIELAYKPALRNKDIFGEDAALFRPERWITVHGDQLTLMDETFRFVFGGPSRWECLGKSLAFMQMHKVVFELFRQFDVTLVNPITPWKAAGHRIWIIEDFFVQVTRRS